MKNPYGLQNGLLVTADSVARGLNCDSTCPACGHRLQSHQGGVKRPYFSHSKSSDCGAGYETAIHLLAKDILLEHKRLVLPSLKAYSDPSTFIEGYPFESEYLVEPGCRFDFDSVQIEKRIGKFIPDVIMFKGNRRLLVEIRVTHAVDEMKREWVIKNNIAMVEFDFSRLPRIIDHDVLKSALVDSCRDFGLGSGDWIHNPKLRLKQEMLTKVYLQKVEAARLRILSQS